MGESQQAMRDHWHTKKKSRSFPFEKISQIEFWIRKIECFSRKSKGQKLFQTNDQVMKFQAPYSSVKLQVCILFNYFHNFML